MCSSTRAAVLSAASIGAIWFGALCPAAEPNHATVAARAGGAPIRFGLIRYQMRLAFGDREIAPQARRSLEARALRQLVNQHAVLAFLAGHNQVASDQDVDLAIAQLERELAQKDATLETFLKNSHITREELRHTLRWRLSWRRYLSQHLTDENLQRYFDDHQRHFDGTRLKVAHILWKNGESSVKALIDTAKKVRADVASGKLTFEQAAAKHSQSPTANTGGDIGLIGRRDPMPERFAAAAFSLEQGEVSEPVVTKFGVHLIRVLEEVPGAGAWQQARDELVDAVRRYLFEWAAGRGKSRIEVQYTADAPLPAGAEESVSP